MTFRVVPLEVLLPYTAGLLDGEGTIIIRRDGAVKVGIASQHLAVLKMVQGMWKGTITSHNRVHRWELTSKALAGNFLVEVEPFLIIKQQQARLMVKYLLDGTWREAAAYAETMSELNHQLSKDFVELAAPIKYVQPSTESKGGE